MSLRAPVRVPVELKRASRAPSGPGPRERWFRLAEAVGPGGVSLSSELPPELDGPLEIAFHLPGRAEAIRCHGRAAEVVVGASDESGSSDESGAARGAAQGEHAERRALEFVDLGDEDRNRILQYVQERLVFTA